jgi:acetolactate synthase small subunit
MLTQFLLLTTNRSGVLSRITSIVSSTGANIESAAVYPVGASEFAAVHLVAESSDVLRERLVRKLSRLIDVIECSATDRSGNLSIDIAAHLQGAHAPDSTGPGVQR